jgi:serine protease Do
MRQYRNTLSILLLLSVIAMGQFVTPATSCAADRGSVLAQLNDDVAAVAEKSSPAVVSIIATTVRTQRYMEMDPFQWFFGPGMDPYGRGGGQQMVPKERQLRQQGLGSGFIISKDGYILTNNHVVADTNELEVYLSDKRRCKAKLIGTDPETEVAVIKIDEPNLPVLELGDSDAIKVGNIVLAIGSPQGLSQTVTMGIVSALNRTSMQITKYENFIQTDAAINLGNSGGPLLDAQGRAIGINTAIYSNTGGSIGIGFAIPINMAKKIAEKLEKTGKIERGYLGIVMNDLLPSMAEQLGTKDLTGAVVSQVVEKSPSDGVLQVYDAIIELNGKPLKSSSDLRNQVANMSPGEKVNLTVIRGGDRKAVTVTLGNRGDVDEETALQPGGKSRGKGQKVEDEKMDLGISVRPLQSDEAAQLDLSKAEGLLVTKVDENGDAARKGIQPGDVILQVNQKPVNSLADLRDALKTGKEKNSVMLLVRTREGDSLVFVEKSK